MTAALGFFYRAARKTRTSSEISKWKLRCNHCRNEQLKLVQLASEIERWNIIYIEIFKFHPGCRVIWDGQFMMQPRRFCIGQFVVMQGYAEYTLNCRYNEWGKTNGAGAKNGQRERPRREVKRSIEGEAENVAREVNIRRETRMLLRCTSISCMPWESKPLRIGGEKRDFA